MAQTCAVDAMFRKWMAVEFIITMAVDFVILTVTVVGILLRLKMKSNVRELILHDGIVYFCFAFFANLVPVVIMLLQLNPIMDFMGSPVAATVCGIASTRSVRHLTGIRVVASAPAGSAYSSGNSTGPPSYKAQRKGLLSSNGTESASFSTESFPGQPVKAHLSPKVETKTSIVSDYRLPSKRPEDLEHNGRVTNVTWQKANDTATRQSAISSHGDAADIFPDTPSDAGHDAAYRQHAQSPERMV